MTEAARIGIDGGGSGSRARLFRPDGVIFESAGDAANAFSDFEGCVSALIALHQELIAQANWSGPCQIAAGIAGCRLPEIAARLSAALPFQAAVFDDAITATKGALGPRDGTVVGLGTGAFFCRQSSGMLRQISGWGFELGDTGSGAWLGREVLRAALRAEDGQAQHDALTRAVLDPHPLLRFADAKPGAFAALAPLVLEHAETATGARLLAQITAEIESALAALGSVEPEPLILTGGLGLALKPHLPKALQTRLSTPMGDPCDGALALAE